MMSFTVASEDGHNMLGQSVVDFVKSLNDDSVFSVGLNCSLNAAKMAPIIQRMAAETGYYISMFQMRDCRTNTVITSTLQR